MVVLLVRIIGFFAIVGLLGWWLYRVIKSDRKEELQEAIEEKKLQEELNTIASSEFKNSKKVIIDSLKREEVVGKFSNK